MAKILHDCSIIRISIINNYILCQIDFYFRVVYNLSHASSNIYILIKRMAAKPANKLFKYLQIN